MVVKSYSKTELNFHKVHTMTFDSEDIRHIDASKVIDSDHFVIYNYTNPECNGYLRAISFEELCKVIAKQLVKNGVIPGGDES